MIFRKMINSVTNPTNFVLMTFVTIPLLAGCGSQVIVKHTGTVQCFQPKNPPEGKMACELSAAAKVDGRVVFANDKPIQGKDKSAVFSLPLGMLDGKPSMVNSNDIQYFNTPLFNKATKYESLTVTSDGKWVIAATAFDRYKSGQEGYNMVLAWPAARWQQVQLVLDSDQDFSASDSVPLRDRFKHVLGDVAYFKIEGLAAIPSEDGTNSGSLLFGVRETGQDYEHPSYVIKLIKVGYHEDNGNRLRLNNDFKLIDYTQALKNQIPNKSTLALSSIEFDPESQKLYLLTSYEESKANEPSPDSLGAFLWSFPSVELGKSNPELVTADSESCQTKMINKKGDGFCPFEFKGNKAEGLAILGNKRALVVFDDDRVKTQINSEDGTGHQRIPGNESGYMIIELP